MTGASREYHAVEGNIATGSLAYRANKRRLHSTVAMAALWTVATDKLLRC